MTARAAGAALTAAVAALAGCGGSGGDSLDATIELVVPDNNIREEGVECAGARPFRHVHAGTPYAVEAGDGDVVVEGELPAGRAENADPSVEWGVERIPTVCVMTFDVDLPAHPRYRFVIEGSTPVEFGRELVRDGEPLRLVLSG